MAHFYLRKYKFTNNLFYKSLINGEYTISDNKLTVSTNPNLGFSGEYFIHGVIKKDADRTIFRLSQISIDETNFDYMSVGTNPNVNSFKNFLSISHDFKKIMIFDDNVQGIILKG